MQEEFEEEEQQSVDESTNVPVWNWLEPEVKEQAKIYLAKKQLFRMFEALLVGLAFNQPFDVLNFLSKCLIILQKKGINKLHWDLFADFGDDTMVSCDRVKCIPKIPEEEVPEPDRKTFLSSSREHFKEHFPYSMMSLNGLWNLQTKKLTCDPRDCLPYGVNNADTFIPTAENLFNDTYSDALNEMDLVDLEPDE